MAQGTRLTSLVNGSGMHFLLLFPQRTSAGVGKGAWQDPLVRLWEFLPEHAQITVLNFNECQDRSMLGRCHIGIWSISFCRSKFRDYLCFSLSLLSKYLARNGPMIINNLLCCPYRTSFPQKVCLRAINPWWRWSLWSWESGSGGWSGEALAGPAQCCLALCPPLPLSLPIPAPALPSLLDNKSQGDL